MQNINVRESWVKGIPELYYFASFSVSLKLDDQNIKLKRYNNVTKLLRGFFYAARFEMADLVKYLLRTWCLPYITAFTPPSI